MIYLGTNWNLPGEKSKEFIIGQSGMGMSFYNLEQIKKGILVLDPAAERIQSDKKYRGDRNC